MLRCEPNRKIRSSLYTTIVLRAVFVFTPWHMPCSMCCTEFDVAPFLRCGLSTGIPNMSIDPGTEDPRRNDLLAQIKEGMDVVDVDGDKVGSVRFVHMADINDADNVGAEGQDPDQGFLDLVPDDSGDGGGLLDAIGLGDRVTERMERSGYVRIDASGLFSGQKYVQPNQIGGVEGDTVRLTIDKDQIGDPA